MKNKEAMKRKCSIASASCSSSSSSSLIESSPVQEISNNNEQNIKPKSIITKPKRVRKPKKLENNGAVNNSATVPKARSSIYRGVTRHRWTGRYEAHLWDKTSWNSVQNKKGKQIYLGAYDVEEDAAHTYDLAALKYWGTETILNFPVETYTKELEEMQRLTKEEFLATLRRRSSGFSRGVSKYRGVARHHHNGRWEARIGRVWGNKYLYLGTYGTQEEAAAAYDRAAIEFRGPNAVTNFDISNYADKLKMFQLQNENQENKILPEPVKAESEEKTFHQENMTQPKVESMDSQAIILDPLEDLEHPWTLCLDLIGLNSLQMPEMPPIDSSKVEFELLDEKSFEENIELMFDKDSFDTNGFLRDEVSGTEECKIDEEVDVKGPSSSSPSSSQCSNVI